MIILMGSSSKERKKEIKKEKEKEKEKTHSSRLTYSQ